MRIHSLIKTTQTRKKRLGQGHGSGRVKTSGRGQKGQQARRNIPLAFEGGAQPLTKRIPFLRGKDRNFSYQEKQVPVNVEALNAFEKGAVIDMASLIKKGIVVEGQAKKRGIKILAHGTISVSLSVKLPTSLSAKEKIEKAGGTVDLNIK